jgi:charged multivesicular body protein 5
MKKIFGAKKSQDPPLSIQDATYRVRTHLSLSPYLPPPSLGSSSNPWLLAGWLRGQIYKRGDTVDEKIKKLDAELARYKEQIKKTRPGPAQEAVKARAMRVLKQRKM